MFIRTMYTLSSCLPYFRKCAPKNFLLEAVWSVHGIDGVKATCYRLPSKVINVRKPGTFYLQNAAKSVRILQWLALYTYDSSLPWDSSEAFQLIRQLLIEMKIIYKVFMFVCTLIRALLCAFPYNFCLPQRII